MVDEGPKPVKDTCILYILLRKVIWVAKLQEIAQKEVAFITEMEFLLFCELVNKSVIVN